MGRDRVVNDFAAQIAVRLRVLRFERGLSQRQLAELAGCSANSIVRFELGFTGMNARTMRKLARALRVEPFDILNHDTHTSDLGWLVEAMRTDPKLVSFMLAKLGRA
jgi:transcriptional regulator with XRE-family HTH domain